MIHALCLSRKNRDKLKISINRLYEIIDTFSNASAVAQRRNINLSLMISSCCIRGLLQ